MYTNKQLGGANVVHVAADLDDLSATGVHTTSMAIMSKAKVRRVACLLSAAIVSTGAVVVAFKRRPLYGSASGEVTLASLSIPAGTAAGKLVFKDLDSSVFPGDQIIAEVTTAATTSGDGLYGIFLDDAPEQPSESSDMVESA